MSPRPGRPAGWLDGKDRAPRSRCGHRPPTAVRAAGVAADRPAGATRPASRQRGPAGSQGENGRTGGLARFEIAVSLLHLLERIALVDPDLDLAAGHRFEQ